MKKDLYKLASHLPLLVLIGLIFLSSSSFALSPVPVTQPTISAEELRGEIDRLTRLLASPCEPVIERFESLQTELITYSQQNQVFFQSQQELSEFFQAHFGVYAADASLPENRDEGPPLLRYRLLKKQIEEAGLLSPMEQLRSDTAVVLAQYRLWDARGRPEPDTESPYFFWDDSKELAAKRAELFAAMQEIREAYKTEIKHFKAKQTELEETFYNIVQRMEEAYADVQLASTSVEPLRQTLREMASDGSYEHCFGFAPEDTAQMLQRLPWFTDQLEALPDIQGFTFPDLNSISDTVPLLNLKLDGIELYELVKKRLQDEAEVDRKRAQDTLANMGDMVVATGDALNAVVEFAGEAGMAVVDGAGTVISVPMTALDPYADPFGSIERTTDRIKTLGKVTDALVAACAENCNRQGLQKLQDVVGDAAYKAGQFFEAQWDMTPEGDYTQRFLSADELDALATRREYYASVLEGGEIVNTAVGNTLSELVFAAGMSQLTKTKWLSKSGEHIENFEAMAGKLRRGFDAGQDAISRVGQIAQKSRFIERQLADGRLTFEQAWQQLDRLAAIAKKNKEIMVTAARQLPGMMGDNIKAALARFKRRWSGGDPVSAMRERWRQQRLARDKDILSRYREQNAAADISDEELLARLVDPDASPDVYYPARGASGEPLPVQQAPEGFPRNFDAYLDADSGADLDMDWLDDAGDAVGLEHVGDPVPARLSGDLGQGSPLDDVGGAGSNRLTDGSVANEVDVELDPAHRQQLEQLQQAAAEQSSVAGEMTRKLEDLGDTPMHRQVPIEDLQGHTLRVDMGTPGDAIPVDLTVGKRYGEGAIQEVFQLTGPDGKPSGFVGKVIIQDGENALDVADRLRQSAAVAERLGIDHISSRKIVATGDGNIMVIADDYNITSGGKMKVGDKLLDGNLPDGTPRNLGPSPYGTTDKNGGLFRKFSDDEALATMDFVLDTASKKAVLTDIKPDNLGFMDDIGGKYKATLTDVDGIGEMTRETLDKIAPLFQPGDGPALPQSILDDLAKFDDLSPAKQDELLIRATLDRYAKQSSQRYVDSGMMHGLEVGEMTKREGLLAFNERGLGPYMPDNIDMVKTFEKLAADGLDADLSDLGLDQRFIDMVDKKFATYRKPSKAFSDALPDDLPNISPDDARFLDDVDDVAGSKPAATPEPQPVQDSKLSQVVDDTFDQLSDREMCKKWWLAKAARASLEELARLEARGFHCNYPSLRRAMNDDVLDAAAGGN